VQGIATRKNELVLAELDEHGVEVYPGSVRYLRAVKDAGLATAVVTASANGEQVVAAGGFADLIDARSTASSPRARACAASRTRTPSSPAPARWASSRRRPSCSRTRCPAWPPGGPGNFGFVVGVDRVGQADELPRARRRRRRQDLAELLEWSSRTRRRDRGAGRPSRSSRGR
jgi:hypothetical protein